jgi:hypothetical protein
MTPPGTAGLEALKTEKAQEEERSKDLQGSQWTATPGPSTPATLRQRYLFETRLPNRPSNHRRALSDSTCPDATSAVKESDVGAFKIIISKPGDERRAKTMEDLDPNRMPLLDISIPSWKLGTPRFTMKGTPFFRGSSYAPTEDFRSSSASLLYRSHREPTIAETITPRKPSPLSIPEIQLAPADLAGPASPTSPRLPPPIRLTYMSANFVIEPSMFDALTLKPDCDDRSIVRYSAATGAVTAATPPRLVAEITSPSFLDYELISDFFLTYRAFLDSSDLLRMLVARLRWALARNDEVGMVVRVRTFVALRHWILNYFMDDFVVDYKLRVIFCNLLNDFVDELSNDLRGRKVQLKILGELKKCWRRVCAQYWDGAEFNVSLGPGAPIAPGGIAGHRNPTLDPSFWEREYDGPPQLDSILLATNHQDHTGLYTEVSRAGHIHDSTVIFNRPETPPNRSIEQVDNRHLQASPTSFISVDVVSCSFPSAFPLKNMRMPQPGASYVLPAHPVEPSSTYTNAGPVATTPRALVGKRVRPTHTGHKRNGSLTDSLREHNTDKFAYKDSEFLLALPYAGSLVRGNLLPPGQPFVEVSPPSFAGEYQRQTTVIQPHDEDKEKAASAMSGPGMKKLLGSVRRALSTRGQGISPTQGNFINISPPGPRGATTNRLPGTAIVPQARPRQNGIRPPVRIDLLGAEIAEDFKKAVREDAAAEAEERRGFAAPIPALLRPIPGEELEYSPAHMNSSVDELNSSARLRAVSDTGITTGSKSIVIVDDTMPFDLPSMTGALPAVNPSVEAFADTFLPNGADPTPPNTPPGYTTDVPRRSSYLLNQHVVRPSLSEDPLPTFTRESILNSAGRPSVDRSAPVSHRYQMSGSSYRGHRRHGSSRTNRSLTSMLRRRYSSYHEATTAPTMTVRSFDATTYSGASVLDDQSENPVPQPLRVLRRRPGGDLRAATNVGELDAMPLHRSKSVGSLTTYTDSARSSYLISPSHASTGFVNVVASDCSQDRGEIFSLGAMAEQAPKRQLSLFSTHSSKPIMRPSFEAEAQKLAQIPDDVDDDGGVESALLKLEGKFEKRAVKLSMEPTNIPMPRPEEIGVALGSPEPEVSREEKKEHRQLHVGDNSAIAHGHSSGLLPSSDAHGSYLTVPGMATDTLSFSEESRESYSSIPLLERGLTDERRSKRATREWTNMSVLQGSDEEDDITPTETERGRASYDFVEKIGSLEKIQSNDTGPAESEAQSFLDDDSLSEGDSDLSSELSAEVVGDEDYSGDEDAFPPIREGVTVKQLSMGPLGDPRNMPLRSHPPSPPMTLVQALQMSPETAHIPQVHEHQVWAQKPLPPTPETTPTAAYSRIPESPRDPTGTTEALRGAPRLPGNEISRKFSVHLPFILAFDSEILAQQFTLIEKDALNEIDWKELIDMGWKNATNNDSRSWVDFLRNSDAHGVEVVIARFNIMVKWAVSEIVLTQDIEERARCIIKFIHIASHCRRYRNFATMSQIAIALTSQEVSRLSQTWAMIPQQDVKTLRELEQLVSPTRNFFNLRAEMESGADNGCIPFVGIYTHDLLFNAQRPSEIASSPTTAPLVNFERCRCAATIVKTLLRLLEASTLYQFQPIEGITERCLWMSALTDEQIRKHSESLE